MLNVSYLYRKFTNPLQIKMERMIYSVCTRLSLLSNLVNNLKKTHADAKRCSLLLKLILYSVLSAQFITKLDPIKELFSFQINSELCFYFLCISFHQIIYIKPFQLALVQCKLSTNLFLLQEPNRNKAASSFVQNNYGW